ncbi:Putative NADPH dehydrogenase C23G7.10c [Taphrina deformans PYCC 5710]|uniref:NADPH dehydrogenase C23G7.10c n=1 Tax=Taphrina deformans (strain PYCC 5710 / ATCC 11124 / CBS 356.35 / IMI 108563 / JCM 9778 / NBRC 8474) TaxID=1097556 RepID=R4X989_TAPDE|nr:Putative NADPH dehydrogenase C23G7.10c [Taphrina deformans PYCC 5710]|eukprot:CCG82286.1 Putative NADPH dehydrogenase C23G7.10c [Taphrina deformans PYCC 5710]
MSRYQVHFAEQIKNAVPDLLIGSVGMIWRAPLACEVIDQGKADVVLVAREFLRDPSLVLTWATELGVQVKYPIQYHRAARPPQGAKFLGAGDRKDGTEGVGGKEAAKASDKHHGTSPNKL